MSEEDQEHQKFQEHFHPNIIHDTSADTPGVIASELAAEEDGLLSNELVRTHSYGAALDDNTYEIDDPNGGYALPKAQLYTVVSSLFMASFLAALDGTVVTTLLTLIASDLNAVSNISWIATAYLLSSAAFQPIFGKLSDIFGRRSLLLGCSALFGIGCVICGVADSVLVLVIGRFITGWGGSGLTSLGTITMSDMIPLRDRGYYQGLANICFGLGSASGGIIGGVIADWIGWKFVFLLQVPLAALVFLAIYFYLNLPAGSPGLGVKGNTSEKLKRVDFLGASLLVSSLMVFLIATSVGGRQIAYSSYTFIGLSLGSLILLLLFVYVELYVSEEPILPIELFANRTVLSSSLTNWFYTMAVFTTLFYVPIYYSAVLGLSATENGMRLVPNFFSISFGSVGAGLYMRATGRYYSLAVLSGFLAIFGVFRIFFLSPDTPNWQQYVLLIPSGLAYSCMLTVTLLALIAAAPLKYQACTTSIQYTFRSTGSTLGVSAATAVFQNVLLKQLTAKINKLITDPKKAAKIIEKALDSTEYVNKAPKIVRQAIVDSYDLGCKGAFAFAVATMILGVVSSLFMREHKLHKSVNRD
ncbi:fnx2 Vacuolar membrane amino acid uptake transporter fnx2 [Candida maltosa Xu316]|uniref:Putative MFS-MDR transporter n=1 Tax=Candida maltosa (strain Xu316) TaxID=1245528 RepID=M3IPP4_CANMX|nr:putative MFS-MDR transporter [Candida maltosa Xu316]